MRISAALDGMLEKVAGERMGFALVVFPLKRTGEVVACSNVKRGQFEQVLANMLETSEPTFIPASIG